MSAVGIRCGRLSAILAFLMLAGCVALSFGLSEDGQPIAGDWSVFLPENAAKPLVVKSCFNCHDLARVVKLRGDKDFWSELIWNMASNGAEFSSEDVDAMSSYLGSALAPKQEPLAVPININTAKPEALRLLSPIAEQADAIVKARQDGKKFQAPEDLLQVDGITKETLQKIRPFISMK